MGGGDGICGVWGATGGKGGSGDAKESGVGLGGGGGDIAGFGGDCLCIGLSIGSAITGWCPTINGRLDGCGETLPGFVKSGLLCSSGISFIIPHVLFASDVQRLLYPKKRDSSG